MDLGNAKKIKTEESREITSEMEKENLEKNDKVLDKMLEVLGSAKEFFDAGAVYYKSKQ